MHTQRTHNAAHNTTKHKTHTTRTHSAQHHKTQRTLRSLTRSRLVQWRRLLWRRLLRRRLVCWWLFLHHAPPHAPLCLPRPPLSDHRARTLCPFAFIMIGSFFNIGSEPYRGARCKEREGIFVIVCLSVFSSVYVSIRVRCVRLTRVLHERRNPGSR